MFFSVFWGFYFSRIVSYGFCDCFIFGGEVFGVNKFFVINFFGKVFIGLVCFFLVSWNWFKFYVIEVFIFWLYVCV